MRPVTDGAKRQGRIYASPTPPNYLTLSSRQRRRIEGPYLSISKGRSLDTARERAYSG